ncbi:hypothetical protein [Aureibaculum conchae]|uniref:hypothetical protein n=1 Tax=Aureibaculum sp. 2308TA14-22 TaxID=3108392 RepID=UPI003393788C
MKVKKINNKIFNYIVSLFIFQIIAIQVFDLFGISGFAAIPYYRLSNIIFTFFYFLTEILLKKLTLKNTSVMFIEDIIVSLWFGFTCIELLYGILLANPLVYLIADFVYIAFGILIYIIISNMLKFKKKLDFDTINWYATVIIILSYLVILFDLTVPSILFIVLISLSYFYLIEKKYLKSIIALIPFFLEVSNSNRALLLVFMAMLLLYFIYRLSIYFKKLDRIIIITLILILILTTYQEIITLSLNFFSENSEIYFRLSQMLDIINEGIDYSSPYHISVSQRLIEAQIVISLWTENIFSFIFGSGLGGVIDGKYFIDNAVISSALLGEKSIHNIHLLPFAFIHKYGFLGLIIMILLIVDFFNSIKKSIRYGSSTIHNFWNILFVLIFIYSIPAASFLWTSALFWVTMAMKRNQNVLYE